MPNRALFRVADTEDAVLASPIASADDLVANVNVIAARARLDHPVVAHLERLERQLSEWLRRH